MVFLLPRRVRDKLWAEPLPPPDSFQGQTVLITGATSGLGLAAAVHFANLGANLILTARTLAAGHTAAEHVETRVGIVGQGRIRVLELDMSRYSSCVSFVSQLKQHTASSAGRLDVVILNAGLINVDFKLSPEGWEQTIQVNTLSTALLGLLLLEWMGQQPNHKSKSVPPHIVFVTSRDHLDPDITPWEEYSARPGGLLRFFSEEQNWPRGALDPNYAVSKLALTYAVEKLCERAAEADGRVNVVINTVCPGLVSTSLGRSIVESYPWLKVLVPMHQCLFGKSADFGARFYVKAARTSVDEHGKYIQSLFTEDEYRRYG
ncbi:putative short chain dehydrogenase/reductase family oxidoreductase [Aspergillus fischeri NRRL 181]|uniref:Short chain dehydrogenase/reductase family oxidoreductase, putative n=1 Tax=Neosartorya fischeri (strain ATCC 1020 / DSM 3700 / CBS 544.65 / FGSC A1164 / JCM 1740 / NRRL 181 / WB 181) TaxID=331117 RepID=A1D5S3_NEOFI|nr:short chain dehydrogenase/reductase family oxidoreductase, putative [Aspergillus fischeri NRRL 181]EAW21067.1 short chain dehydrogenase/reductase family oxidoreductase, putative [Aspergillus fischeri NRRL 181]